MMFENEGNLAISANLELVQAKLALIRVSLSNNRSDSRWRIPVVTLFALFFSFVFQHFSRESNEEELQSCPSTLNCEDVCIY